MNNCGAASPLISIGCSLYKRYSYNGFDLDYDVAVIFDPSAKQTQKLLTPNSSLLTIKKPLPM